jgi:hypothetical protein
MAVWDRARHTGWPTRAVIAAAVLAAVLVAAVPVALVVGIILMVLGHVIGGLALFGGSILAAVGAVTVAAVSGVWRVRQLLTERLSGAQQPYRVVPLDPGEYDYS